MGLKLKVCADCGQQKKMGRSKSRCKSCRKTAPNKFLNRAAGSGTKHKKKIRISIGPFKDWQTCHLPKCVFPQNKECSTIGLGKKQRNFVLKAHGYKNYAVYLQSELWASIRTKVLQGAVCACGCGQPANQVHHRAYTEANLTGASLQGLVPINHDCHYKIEFSEGQKTSLGEANHELKKRQTQNTANPGKTDSACPIPS